jgi:hypothetical protein
MEGLGMAGMKSRDKGRWKSDLEGNGWRARESGKRKEA